MRREAPWRAQLTQLEYHSHQQHEGAYENWLVLPSSQLLHEFELHKVDKQLHVSFYSSERYVCVLLLALSDIPMGSSGN